MFVLHFSPCKLLLLFSVGKHGVNFLAFWCFSAGFSITMLLHAFIFSLLLNEHRKRFLSRFIDPFGFLFMLMRLCAVQSHDVFTLTISSLLLLCV